MSATAAALSAQQIAGLIALNSGLSLGSGLGGSALGSANSSKAMKQQYIYQRELLDQQFKYNNYIQQHSHQHEVYDLKHAGLNPILSANGGNTMSVGLPSVSAVENSSGMANTMSDTVNTAMQNVNTAFANNTSAKAVENAKPVQVAQAGLFKEEAQTESVKRENIASSTALNNAEKELKQIDKLYMPQKYKADIKATLSNAMSNMISAKANSLSASANQLNAQTNMGRAAVMNYLDTQHGHSYNIDNQSKIRDYNVSGGDKPNNFAKMLLKNKYFRPGKFGF